MTSRAVRSVLPATAEVQLVEAQLRTLVHRQPRVTRRELVALEHELLIGHQRSEKEQPEARSSLEVELAHDLHAHPHLDVEHLCGTLHGGGFGGVVGRLGQQVVRDNRRTSASRWPQSTSRRIATQVLRRSSSTSVVDPGVGRGKPRDHRALE